MTKEKIIMATKQYEVTVCFPHSCSIKAVVLGNSVADALRAAHAQFPQASAICAPREI